MTSMAPISSDNSTSQPSSSLTRSPTSEEDISRAHTRGEFEYDDYGNRKNSNSPASSSSKGKAKQSLSDISYDSEEGHQRPDAREVYPPTNEEAEETRRVEENLRRWELAERQRRKAARESQAGVGGGGSLLTDVTRRASILLKGRTSQRPSSNSELLGNHQALQSRDSVDVVPLHDINRSVLTPSTSPKPDHSRNSRDPFAHPADPLSPFADPEAVAKSTRRPTTHTRDSGSSSGSSQLPAIPSSPPLRHRSLNSLGHPPPQIPSAHIPKNTLPKPMPPPSLQPPATQADEGEVRWWHDWLCGCSEGPDRGGNVQAGATNPFE